MFVIGVTGSSGSGKSSFVQYLASILQAPVIDADQVYHDLISMPSPCTTALTKAYGKTVLRADGGIDRAALASMVFGHDDVSKARLKQLNQITHYYVKIIFKEKLDMYEKNGCTYVLLDVPLLFESGFHMMCEATICVLAPYEVRLSRIMNRDQIERGAACQRLNAQPVNDFYVSQSKYVVNNHGDKTDLQKEAVRIASLIRSKE